MKDPIKIKPVLSDSYLIIVGVLILIFLILTFGCASTTEVVWHDGKTITITGASDEVITAKIGKDEVVSDRRGKENIFQSFVNMLMFKGMNTETK